MQHELPRIRLAGAAGEGHQRKPIPGWGLLSSDCRISRPDPAPGGEPNMPPFPDRGGLMGDPEPDAIIVPMQDAILDPDTKHAANAFIAKVASRYDLVGSILFGSRARRDHRPDSDADIAVLLRGQRGQFLDTKLEMADIAYEVLLDTGVLIQPLPVWEDEWEHPETYTNPTLLRNIGSQGIRL